MLDIALRSVFSDGINRDIEQNTNRFQDIEAL